MTNYFKKPDRLVDAVKAVLAGKGNEYAQELLNKDSVDETNKNDDSDDGEGLDAVQPKAVKKKFKDRKDKDIDNDGDTDDSDEYIHKKRKAISKKIKDDDVKEDKEEEDEPDPDPKDDNGEDKKKKKKAKKVNGKKDEVDTEPQFDDQKQLPAEQKEEVELTERELSSIEKKKKEDIVMGMKKKMPDFEKKYGDRAKDVMYATATKIAMKEGLELTEIDISVIICEDHIEEGAMKRGEDLKTFSKKPADVKSHKGGVQQMPPIKGKVKPAVKVVGQKKPKTMLVVKKGTQTVTRVPIDHGKELMRKGTHLEAESVEHDEDSINEISPETQKSYYDKAKKQQKYSDDRRGQGSHTKRAVKRSKGMGSVQKRDVARGEKKTGEQGTYKSGEWGLSKKEPSQMHKVTGTSKPKTMLVVRKGTQTVTRVPVDKGKELMRKGTHLEAESVEHNVKSINEDRMAGKYKRGETIVTGQWSDSWGREYVIPNVDRTGVKISAKGPAFKIEKL